MTTSMTTENVDRLAATINGGSLNRTADKASSIKRYLRMATNESHGSLFDEPSALAILELDFDEALKTINDRMDVVFNRLDNSEEDNMNDENTETTEQIVPKTRSEIRAEIREARKAEREAERAKKAEANAELKAARDAEKAALAEKKAAEKAEREAARAATKEAKAKPADASGSKGRGKPSKFSGKILTATVKDNPRQVGSFGWHSFNVILQNPGITYEDYVAKGGRLSDLVWDVDRKKIEVADPAPATTSEPAEPTEAAAE